MRCVFDSCINFFLTGYLLLHPGIDSAELLLRFIIYIFNVNDLVAVEGVVKEHEKIYAGYIKFLHLIIA